jgi:type VI secretion system lysozyme-like protein
MPDVTEFIHALPEAVDDVCNAIRTSIQRFEPRLQNVEVTNIPPQEGGLTLRFEITGELVTGDEEAAVWFETEVTPSGRIEVRG